MFGNIDGMKLLMNIIIALFILMIVTSLLEKHSSRIFLLREGMDNESKSLIEQTTREEEKEHTEEEEEHATPWEPVGDNLLNLNSQNALNIKNLQERTFKNDKGENINTISEIQKVPVKVKDVELRIDDHERNVCTLGLETYNYTKNDEGEYVKSDKPLACGTSNGLTEFSYCKDLDDEFSEQWTSVCEE